MQRLRAFAHWIEHRGKGRIDEDLVKERFGKCSKQLKRLLPLLDLPRVLQRAFDEKIITATQGYELLQVPKGPLQELADAINCGPKVKNRRRLTRQLVPEAINKYLSPASEPEVTTDVLRKWLQKFLQLSNSLNMNAENLLDTIAPCEVHYLAMVKCRLLETIDRYEKASGRKLPEWFDTDTGKSIEQTVEELRPLVEGLL